MGSKSLTALPETGAEVTESMADEVLPVAIGETLDALPATAPVQNDTEQRGILLAIGAYGSWAILPIYFKAIAHVPALEILANRIVWSLFFMLGIITWKQGWNRLRRSLRNMRALRIYAIAALLLGVNWYVYIWAVNAGHILDSSLGYFINPLVSVLLAVLVLRERLRPLQWAAIALAAAGVGYLTWNYGQLPWIALTLAFSFALYGLLKKLAPLPPEEGMTIETATLFIPALAVLVWAEMRGDGALIGSGGYTLGMLLLAGPLTALPLLMFAGAARAVPLSMLGILQYIAPTGQFLIGVYLYGEEVTAARLIGFAIIWLAIIVYWGEGAWRRRRKA